MVWPEETAEAVVVVVVVAEQAGELMAVAKWSLAPRSFDSRYHRNQRA